MSIRFLLSLLKQTKPKSKDNMDSIVDIYTNNIKKILGHISSFCIKTEKNQTLKSITLYIFIDQGQFIQVMVDKDGSYIKDSTIFRVESQFQVLDAILKTEKEYKNELISHFAIEYTNN